jgi:DNA-binding MarR family transcriptional regulator
MTSKTKRRKPGNSEMLAMDNALEIGTSCACFNLRKGARRVTRLFDAALRPSGLKATQLTLLTAIRISEQVTIKRLAKVMAMDRTTLSRNVSVLNRKGLIDIEPGDDLRTRKLSLTERGHAALAAAFPLWKKAQHELIGHLGEKRWADLMKGIADLALPDFI